MRRCYPDERSTQRNCRFMPSGACRRTRGMDVVDHPLRSAEFLVVDTETNGYGGERCELTEVGAVLVGGGELHDRFASLCAVRAPLSRGVQRLTGITNSMVDEAPEAEIVLVDLIDQMEGRVLVGHNIAFDRRGPAPAGGRPRPGWAPPPPPGP